MNNSAYSIAGREQLTKKQLKYARKLSRRSLKLRPDNSAFLDTYGWIWYRLERYRKAGKYVNKSIKVKPDNPVVLDHMGEIYLRSGKAEEARVMFERAERIRRGETPALVRAKKESISPFPVMNISALVPVSNSFEALPHFHQELPAALPPDGRH